MMQDIERTAAIYYTKFYFKLSRLYQIYGAKNWVYCGVRYNCRKCQQSLAGGIAQLAFDSHRPT